MEKVKFAVIGDCHHSKRGNYSTRDCLGARKQLQKIIDTTNTYELDFVLSLGDMGDGFDMSETPEMLEVYAGSVNPVKFTIGNHDLCTRNDEEHAKFVGMPAPFYDYEIKNYKFVVLNAFEQSRYSPADSENRKVYEKFVEENQWLRFQPWPGLMTEESWQRLENILTDATAKNMNIILFSHVPTLGFAGEHPARLPEHIRMIELLDRFPNVRAYISGHCHGGGLSVRNGVMHKTLRSVCDHPEPTACIFEADDTSIIISGIGNETDFTHDFEMTDVVISGTAPEDSYVMTNCGDVVKVGEDGRFALSVPCSGMYSIKAVKDGCDDCYIPRIEAPATGIDIRFSANPARKLYTGYVDGYKTLRITDDGHHLHWFDIAGTQYGAVVPEVDMWYDICNNYWAKGMYAFTGEGDVKIRVLPQHKQLKEQGWYKGDLHAHIIHGENLYVGNVQQSGFIGQAEGYDWLYMAADYSNDDYTSDAHTIARKMSSEDFLYRLNAEFPKSRSNHFGNCCVNPVGETVDVSKISSLELAKRHIWDRGGVTVPVHPFYGHMCFRELCLWILCAPDMMPCIDFFYHDDFPKHLAEDYWFMLLNRGYEIGCFATSDAAFDVGRTPGSNRGATYLYMNTLSEESVKQAILDRRSMVSWDCAAALFSIDEYTSGDKIAADGREHKLSVKLMWQKDRCGVLRVIRNGKDVMRQPVSFLEDEQELCFDMNIAESENCWYAVILESEDGKIRSVASPIYFRNDSFVAPKVLNLIKPIPEEILAECEKLTFEDIARPELIGEFEQMLINAGVAEY